MSQPVEYEQLSYNVSTGAQFATSTGKIGFYGAVPQAQYATGISVASTYVVSTSVISGFSTADQVTSLVSQVSNIVVMLRLYGLAP